MLVTAPAVSLTDNDILLTDSDIFTNKSSPKNYGDLHNYVMIQGYSILFFFLYSEGVILNLSLKSLKYDP